MMIRSKSSSLIIIALLFILISVPALAQGRSSGSLPTKPISASITGVVRYTDGGAPAEFVIVSLESNLGGLLTQVRTDRSGKFKFDSLAQAQFRISIRHVGFNEVQRFVDLSTTTTEYLQIQLVAEPRNTDLLTLPAKTVNAAVPAEAQKEYEAGQQALLEEKNILTGILHLEKAVNLYPKFTEALLLLGTAYMAGQQWQRAETTLQKTIELEPKLATAYFTLGDTYRRQKKFAEAEQALQAGLKQEPKSPQGHYHLGCNYFDKGDIQKAGAEIGQAIQLKPDFAEAYLVAGNLFMRARRAENALPMFEEYLKLDPKGQFVPQAKEMVEKLKQVLAEKKQ